MEFVERKIIFHGSNFADFYLEQSTKIQEKIEFVLRIIRQVERVSKKFLSPMAGTDGLYEVRVEYGSNIYRFFAALTMGILLFYSTDFRKRHRKLR
jgi:hypothetical protein